MKIGDDAKMSTTPTPSPTTTPTSARAPSPTTTYVHWYLWPTALRDPLLLMTAGYLVMTVLLVIGGIAWAEARWLLIAAGAGFCCSCATFSMFIMNTDMVEVRHGDAHDTAS